ncbi:MAG: fibronectin type III domain-containing protein [Candidatus Aureabacteria bacterium]|nr:fibronectin type III domain-containing protein [Candidatus Auribacterota bacterium]
MKHVPPTNSLTSKLALAFFTVLMLVIRNHTPAYANPPDIHFDNPDFIYKVLVTTDGASDQYLIGRPSAELYQYIQASGYNLPSYDQCLLITDLDGNVIRDCDIVSSISRSYVIYDYLIGGYFRNPNGKQYLDLLIPEIDRAIFYTTVTLNLVPVIQPLEWFRNSIFKGGLISIIWIKGITPENMIHLTAIKAGIGAIVTLGTSICKGALEVTIGQVLPSMVTDNLVFGRTAQRWVAYKYMQSSLDGLTEMKKAAVSLRDSNEVVINGDMVDANYAVYGIYETDPATFPEFKAWWDEIYLNNLNPISQGIDAGSDIAFAFLNYPFGKMAGPVPINWAKYYSADDSSRQLGDLVLRGRELSIHGSTIFYYIWKAAQEKGLLDSQNLSNSFKAFATRIVNGRDNSSSYLGEYAKDIQGAPYFQMCLVNQYFNPGEILNLEAHVTDYTNVRLTWTAPYDDGGAKGISRHQIKYSRSPITEANWNEADDLAWTGPYPGGAAVSIVPTKQLDFGNPYYFAVKAFDDEGNEGPISNSASIVIGQGLNPISLKYERVYPNPGNSFFDYHNYYVQYANVSGINPCGKANVVINGVPHAMSREPKGNYKDGVEYYFSDRTHYNPGSTVSYYFEFATGLHEKRQPETGAHTLLVDPVLYN